MSRLELLKSKGIIFHWNRTCPLSMCCALVGTRFAVANTSIEALAACVAKQNERIQQDEVASGTATPKVGECCVPASILFVARETVLKESKSRLQWAIRVFC